MQERLNEQSILEALVTRESKIREKSFRRFLQDFLYNGIMCFCFFMLFVKFFYADQAEEHFSNSLIVDTQFVIAAERDKTKQNVLPVNQKRNKMPNLATKSMYERFEETYLLQIENEEFTIEDNVISNDSNTPEETQKWLPQYVDDANRLQDPEFIAELKRGFPEYASEVMWLAIAIYAEVGNSTIWDKIFTGSVIINRARTSYPYFKKFDTIYKVLHQRNQYSTIGKIDRIMKNGEKIDQECIDIAQGLIDGTIQCLEECVLFQLLHKPGGSLGKNLYDAKLPGAHEYYGVPKDYHKELEGNLNGNTWTSNYYPLEKAVSLTEEP